MPLMRFFSLTPVQAQWTWLLICVAITAIIIALDVAFWGGGGVETTLSRTVRRVGGRYWSVIGALIWWHGYLMGHIGNPSEF